MMVLQIVAYVSFVQFGPDDLADIPEASALQHCQTLTKMTIQLVLANDKS